MCFKKALIVNVLVDNDAREKRVHEYEIEWEGGVQEMNRDQIKNMIENLIKTEHRFNVAGYKLVCKKWEVRGAKKLINNEWKKIKFWKHCVYVHEKGEMKGHCESKYTYPCVEHTFDCYKFVDGRLVRSNKYGEHHKEEKTQQSMENVQMNVPFNQPQVDLRGGADDKNDEYYAKYLKYKNKYQQEKNRLKAQI